VRGVMAPQQQHQPGGTRSPPTSDDWHVRFNVIQEIKINDTISFAPNSPDIRSESEPILDAVAFVLGNRPEIRRVVVEGHTCDCPSWGYSNQELSEARARTVPRAGGERDG
jgi:outer membrane protein OmpA-like peptidoglycan-associated protein